MALASNVFWKFFENHEDVKALCTKCFGSKLKEGLITILKFQGKELGEWSSESIILDENEVRRMRFLDYGRRRDDRRGRIYLTPLSRQMMAQRTDIQRLDIYNKFLEVLLFCSTMVLWMSGIVMLAFGFYLVLSQYGWAVMTGSTMYWLGMVLQTSSALTVLIAAGITTTLLAPDTGTPKRALIGLAFVLICALLLTSEIIVCSLSKANQQQMARKFYTSLSEKSVNKTLSQQDMTIARSKGYECKNWENNACNELYIKHTSMFLNFLIGSACITLGILILVVPVLVAVYRASVHKITRVEQTPVYSNETTEED